MKGIGSLMMVFIVVILVAGGFMATRLRRVERGALAPKVDLKESVDTYQERMRATERLLVQGRL